MLLSQFYGPNAESPQSGLRIHAHDDTSHPSSESSRAASLANLTGVAHGGAQDFATDAPSQLLSRRVSDALGPPGDSLGGHGYSASDPPQGPVARFQEQQLGMRPAFQQQPFSFQAPPRSGTPGSAYDSGSNTMINSDYAFNPDTHYSPAAEQPRHMSGYGSPDGHSRLSTMLGSDLRRGGHHRQPKSAGSQPSARHTATASS